MLEIIGDYLLPRSAVHCQKYQDSRKVAEGGTARRSNANPRDEARRIGKNSGKFGGFLYHLVKLRGSFCSQAFRKDRPRQGHLKRAFFQKRKPNRGLIKTYKLSRKTLLNIVGVVMLVLGESSGHPRRHEVRNWRTVETVKEDHQALTLASGQLPVNLPCSRYGVVGRCVRSGCASSVQDVFGKSRWTTQRLAILARCSL
jgi:hypothetical protein